MIHTGGSLDRNEQTADGQMGAWEYTLTTWSVQTYQHQLRLVRGEYLSIMASEAEKDRFADQLGWSSYSFRTGAISPDRRPWFIFEHGNWRVLGLGTGETTGGGQTARTFDLPYWLIVVVFGTPVLLAAKRRRKLSKRAREGRCLKCGYQLDANMTKCPECGSTRPSRSEA
jgi:hypothetical protein